MIPVCLIESETWPLFLTLGDFRKTHVLPLGLNFYIYKLGGTGIWTQGFPAPFQPCKHVFPLNTFCLSTG